jgi:hypothetical protein
MHGERRDGDQDGANQGDLEQVETPRLHRGEYMRTGRTKVPLPRSLPLTIVIAAALLIGSAMFVAAARTYTVLVVEHVDPEDFVRLRKTASAADAGRWKQGVLLARPTPLDLTLTFRGDVVTLKGTRTRGHAFVDLIRGHEAPMRILDVARTSWQSARASSRRCSKRSSRLGDVPSRLASFYSPNGGCGSVARAGA